MIIINKISKFKHRIIVMALMIVAGILTFTLSGWKTPVPELATPNGSFLQTDTDSVIHPDHIIFVWLENKEFSTIIGNHDAPYMNSLVKKGTLFTNTFAITHPSYPNYVDFFAGQNNGIISDACIDNSWLTSANLFTILNNAGKSFAWYSEDLPKTGSKICVYNNYVEKHNPITAFGNVPDSVNKRFADLPANYNKLENVVCISPNLINDMHDGTIKQADSWIKKHLSAIVEWCATHNSVFVIYYDESEAYEDNRIPVIAVGEKVKADFKSVKRYDHYSWTKTISQMFSAPDSWTKNLITAKPITDCWQ